ncbi:16S rRNA (cytidine(1402)-2'-O)-methyltransferase [Actinomyces sp. zg-332]|uniref:16S rRNA (cytidine(1402)-2'-O)-methyltransferase n=1 Tax=Actinomyces sp. zg-332 TaxID=2708340 RepID=UPI001420E724|nr:16S rRNA (cytidine(1402)-2'-O)-methyltransferase [Actinomyces sp. zg-332]QPK94286.1 16S rRNA (cytidine(1402)-2'-O)-methyltransferase [Actinomyces sp. zg-332]
MEKYIWPENSPIILAATPIGNVQDASTRLIGALEQADIIAAEDTRKTLNLAKRLNIKLKAKLISCHEHNEKDRVERIVDQAINGRKVLLVTDAGMPTVSDPGLTVARYAIEKNVKYTVIPGPSAPLTALALSGISTDKFTFEGFLPRKENDLEKTLLELEFEKRTMIFFESPRRCKDTIVKMMEIFGENRKIAICRELTKIHEETIRGTIKEILENPLEDILGEVTIVLAGADKKKLDPKRYVDQVLELVSQGSKMKEAVNIVSKATGVSKNELYNVALNIKTKKDSDND